ncbi:MAG: dTDP-4-dehydrorhamnose reductase [Pseudomonadota bacterium]
MRVTVFGVTGQVAHELARRAPGDISVEALGRAEVDFFDTDAVRRATGALSSDAIINAAAYTAVDTAEAERDRAETVNGASVDAMAQARGAIPLVHISTDYVFSGEGETPWRPGDPTAPQGVYGASKLIGETALRRSAGPYAILRTSWVFGAKGGNFVKTMLRLGAARDRLTIVADQVGGPTPAASIADACFDIARALKDGHAGGTYHFSGAPDVSWADFAREIFTQSGRATDVVNIPTTDYPTPAKRPLNSRLDCTDTERDFGIPRPDWRAGLGDVLKEIGAI